MNQQVQKPPTSWPLIILFAVITLSVAITGVLYYNYQKDNLLIEKQQELSAIADLKIRQITQWRFERMSDGKFLGDNIMLIDKIPEFLKDTTTVPPGIVINQILKSLTENYDYRNAILTDRLGNVKLAYPGRDTLIGNNLRRVLPDIARGRSIVMTDLNINRTVNFAHIDLVVPLSGRTTSDTLVSGFLVLRIDPGKVLYPLLSSWPTASKSAETLIVRKEGDDIIFMNELRHQKNTGLILKKQASDTKLPAAMAFRGIKGTVDGVDYRNVHVVASMKKIPGTQWYMVAKIDRDEVFSVLKSQMRLIITILVLFIAAIGLFMGFLMWNQRVVFYRERYEAELERLALFKHFDYILKFANDIIFLFDKDLKVAEVNDRALETYMFARKEMLGMNLMSIQATETLAEINVQLETVNENGSSTFETIHRRSDDTVFPVEISMRVVDIEGSKYYQTIGRDITERKQAEETLRESETRFRKIFEESPFPMVITGKDFGIIRANASFCKMSGYPEEELTQITLNELTHPDDTTDDAVNLMRLIAGDIPVYHKEKRYLQKDGSVIIGSSTISIIRNNKDEAQFFIGMVEDITMKKKAEEELISAKLKAEESDRLKTAFLHNVSHEIRTPMNAILGFSSLMNDPELKVAERQQYTEIIFQSSNQLLSIINDIVDVANIESGQVKVNLARTDLNLSLRNLDEQYSFSEKQHHIPIVLSAGLPDEKAIIITDNTKLIQIISNLINNSIKFTPTGNIEFGYIPMDDYLEFFVKDTGIGIPKESLEKIFDRFYQVDRTVARQFGGTGLGLSICKAYVQLLGGTIGVSSTKGEGTRFSFKIPYIQA